jgi:hypothetical protein
MPKIDVKIAKFDDDAADISIDGRVVGWLERVKGERFRSASSRARVSFVSHYTIMLTDDTLDAALNDVLGTTAHDVPSRSAAIIAVRDAATKATRQSRV